MNHTQIPNVNGFGMSRSSEKKWEDLKKEKHLWVLFFVVWLFAVGVIFVFLNPTHIK